MRVSQIQNLTWAGNVVVLAGLAWVGLQFWTVKKAKTSTEFKWPAVKSVDQGVRWPGELATFNAIWLTPIGGKNPPPPAPPPPPVKLDRWTEFQQKLKYLGGTLYVTAPEYSVARLNYSADPKDISVFPGGMVGTSGFQLLRFTIDESKRDERGHVIKTAVLVFRHPETGEPKTWTQTLAPTFTFPTGSEPVVPRFDGFTGLGRVPRTTLDVTAYMNTETGEWTVSEDEMMWMEDYGGTDLWPKLTVKPDVDGEGVSRGIRIMTPIEQGTPLATSHGINVNDVVRSINGVPMTSKEDVALYLRGRGRGLSTYRVVVDTEGKERTVVYHIARPRAGR